MSASDWVGFLSCCAVAAWCFGIVTMVVGYLTEE